MFYIHAYTYAALYMYQQLLGTMVRDEEMTPVEFKFPNEGRVYVLITDSFTCSILNSSVAAAVITARLMKSGDIESNPGPGEIYVDTIHC